MKKLVLASSMLAIAAVASAQSPRTFTFNAGTPMSALEIFDGTPGTDVSVTTTVNVHKYLYVTGNLNSVVEVNGAGSGTSGQSGPSSIQVTHVGDVTITPSLNYGDLDGSALGVMTLSWQSNSTPTSPGLGTPATFVAVQNSGNPATSTGGQFHVLALPHPNREQLRHARYLHG